MLDTDTCIKNIQIKNKVIAIRTYSLLNLSVNITSDGEVKHLMLCIISLKYY